MRTFLLHPVCSVQPPQRTGARSSGSRFSLHPLILALVVYTAIVCTTALSSFEQLLSRCWGPHDVSAQARLLVLTLFDSMDDDTEDVELSASETHSVECSGTGLSTTRDTYAGKRLIQEATLFIQEGEALRRQEETDRETTSVEA